MVSQQQILIDKVALEDVLRCNMTVELFGSAEAARPAVRSAWSRNAGLIPAPSQKFGRHNI
jgi:hypothetical protein